MSVQNIQSLFNKGEIYNGTKLAKQLIFNNGIANSQKEIYLLAKGLFASGDICAPYFWATKTNVSEAKKLIERINRRMLGPAL